MHLNTKQHQVYETLKERIQNGDYPVSSKLPTEVELATQLGVSRITLRVALKQLEQDCLIDRLKGKGTFVHNDHNALKLLVINDGQDPSNPFHYIYPGMQEKAQELNVTLELCSTALFPDHNFDLTVKHILDCGFCGIVWFTNNFNGYEKSLVKVKQIGLPVLLPHALPRDAMVTGFHVMGVDFKQVILDGLQFLASKGHRRVAHFSSLDMRGLTPDIYFQCVRDIGLDPDPQLLQFISDHFNTPLVGPILENLFLSREKPPTALLCFSDFYASQIYNFCLELQIRIPQDLAILSIGGHIGCQFINPTLSTIDFNSHQIGHHALTYFRDLILGRTQPRNFITCNHRIIPRESTDFQRN